MKKKSIKALLAGVQLIETRGPDLTDFDEPVYDSRNVKKGSIFFALKGVHTDGHKFIEKAIKTGAAIIFHSDSLTSYDENVLYVEVENTRKAMSLISANYWDHPSKELKVVGVTGTDGKSSTCSFIMQLLEAEKAPTGLLTTVSVQTGDELESNPFRQSTPEAPEIHRILRKMVDNGKKFAVVEATSHGLSAKTSRLADVHFDVAVLTNVTHEHLEFHGSLEQYRLDKANLFVSVSKENPENSFAVVNLDDDMVELFMDSAGAAPIYTYGTKSSDCDLFLSKHHCDLKGTDCVFDIPGGQIESRVNLTGLFNVENMMAALLVVSELLEEDLEDIVEHVPPVKGVLGRMEAIECDKPFDVIVDYAHTPGSFEKLFPTVKQFLKGRLIVIFGSAGERDIDKRELQGEIADNYCHTIILTDEDPRGEDSMLIIDAIAEGIKEKDLGSTLFKIPDRKEAIEKAISLALPGDVILTLGKSHESSIIYADGPKKWDEISVVKKALGV